MPFWDNQEVRRCLRVDVAKRQGILCIGNYVGGDLTIRDAAEKALVSHLGHD